MLTLSEDRDGGGVAGAVFVPTLSEDLQRDTSIDIILLLRYIGEVISAHLVCFEAIDKKIELNTNVNYNNVKINM